MRWTFFIQGFWFALLFLVQPLAVHGALLYFDPASTDVYRGDSVTLSLRLDTDEGECINTIDATVHYDESVRAVDISRGDSILNIWVEDPVIDESAHTIKFAGGIPGGYCGRIPGDPSLTNVILKLVFRSPGFSIGGGDSQSARVWVDENVQVLLHDGYGTNADTKLQDALINLMSTPGTNVSDTWRSDVGGDADLPSDFSITLTKDDTAFSGRYFVVFNSSDKQSGIDHYEIMEEPFSEFFAFAWGRADAPWVRVESPYVLEDQTLNSTIRIKAIDKAGNERIATLVPDTALRSMSQDALITTIVAVGVIGLLSTLIVYGLWKRRQRVLENSNKIDNE
ncbi:MAG: hypothetical protein NUW00_04800 [Candidatus Kaiserbacteria bacterium]|nr:hypothetical protein [Candidatus Kaiserbacteria bacterium]